jgi:hypothetical protein
MTHISSGRLGDGELIPQLKVIQVEQKKAGAPPRQYSGHWCTHQVSEVLWRKIQALPNKNLDYLIPKQTLYKMLVREETLRFSKEYLEDCDRIGGLFGYLRATANLQENVVKSFGFKGEMLPIALNILRRASTIYPNEKKFTETQVYCRNNKKAKACKFRAGDKGNLDIKLHDLDGKGTSLKDLIHPKKKNILIASSATWPPLRPHINDLNKFYEARKRDPKINIIFIYIQEAHASDVWPIGKSAGALNKKHKILSNRIQCAEEFRKENGLKMPVYVDNMKDEFEDAFSAWPLRFYILEGNTFEHIPVPRNSSYDWNALFNVGSSIKEIARNRFAQHSPDGRIFDAHY